MAPKLDIRLIIAAALAIALAIVLILVITSSSGGAPPPVACTMDAKICPDGSAVGRVAPNCDFAPCPPGRGVRYCETDSDCVLKYNILFGGQCIAGCFNNDASSDPSCNQAWEPLSGTCKCVGNQCLMEGIQGCQDDAKVCPDGSTVGRVAPSCDFAPCPSSTCAAGQYSSANCDGACAATHECTQVVGTQCYACASKTFVCSEWGMYSTSALCNSHCVYPNWCESFGNGCWQCKEPYDIR